MYVLAISSGVQNFLILAGATVIATIVIGFGKAMMGIVRTRQIKGREEENDQRVLSEFLFGSERDPRTGTPAKEGWTDKVDRSLAELTASQSRIEKAVHLTLSEVVQDGNGGHNMRGAIDRLDGKDEQ